MGRILLVIFILASVAESFAGSCCGQSPASFMVLSSNQKLSVNTAYSVIESEGRVFNSDEFYVWNQKKRQAQALQLNVAGTIADRHQYYVTTSFVSGSYKDVYGGTDASHLSDTQIGYTYEVLPEYSFSYWRPVIYLSALVNLPTGKSIYNSQLSEGADVTGHEQWGLGAGFTARKVYFPLTLTFQARSLRIFSENFGALKISDFYDSSAAFLTNYVTRFQDVSVNLGVTLNHLSSRAITPGGFSGEMQNMSLLVGLQKTFGDEWSAGLNYADQTLLGPAKNSILNRTMTLNLSYNYF